MPIPSRDKIKQELIEFIQLNGGRSQSVRIDEAYNAFEIKFALTEAEKSEKRGNEPLWKNELRWAREALVREGVLLPPERAGGRGIWKLSLGSQVQKPTASDDALNEDPTPYIPNKDDREKVLREITARRGQSNFRNSLLDAYNRRCCITDCNCVDALEAAHISAYSGPKSNSTRNGLLLRADIHTLFDLNLITITEECVINIDPKLHDTDYKQFDGKKIHLPSNAQMHPSRTAIQVRNAQAKS